MANLKNIDGTNWPQLKEGLNSRYVEKEKVEPKNQMECKTRSKLFET